MSLALVVRLDISEVARVSILAVWQTMLVAFRVKVASRAHAVWGGAISILMDVEGVLLAGRQSFDVCDHLHRFAFLSEAHYALAVLPGCRV
jgi:hypothetical protein